MIILQGVTYVHPNKDVLFSDINLTVNKHDKIALIGNNGAGKSTLLKIIAQNLHVSQGLVKADSLPYYIPQHFGQFNDLTIATALGVEVKLTALKQILAGNVTETNMLLLDDDWTIEERCNEALLYWGLEGLDFAKKMDNLSGGQKTKVFLAGIHIHKPEIVLLDEPSNHLDVAGRQLLYDYISTTRNTVMVVSHDITLLNLLTTVCELSRRGITTYGGNYDFYINQKAVEEEALSRDVKSKEKAIRKAKEVERESMERQNKLDTRGKKKQEKAGLPTISMNTLKNNAEKSTSRLQGIHTEKINTITKELQQLRDEVPDISKMKLDLDSSSLHKGKVLITAKQINFSYKDKLLWQESMNFQIISGERIAIKGANGSGKTTLIKMILGELVPQQGTIQRVDFKPIYIDQDYSVIKNNLTVYEQAQEFNSGVLEEHDIKMRLSRFLFTNEYWNKPCSTLSGGEKMRLILCSLTIRNQAPDLLILDEPTNNLDIQNVEILTAAINAYSGTLLVVSHDEYFLKQINIQREIVL